MDDVRNLGRSVAERFVSEHGPALVEAIDEALAAGVPEEKVRELLEPLRGPVPSGASRG